MSLRITRRALIGAAATTISAAALAACSKPGSTSTPGSADGATLTIYNAQHETLAQEWMDGFTKATGIKVTHRQGDDTEMANQLVAEGANSPADVFLTENSPAMTLVENAGLLAATSEEIRGQVPSQYRPSTNAWTGIAARSTVFVYNTDKLKQADLPASLMDLAKPEWKGRWAASPSGADFQAIITAILQLKGEDETLSWLKAMKQNSTAIKGNSAVMKAVNAGEFEGGVIYHYYYFGDQAKGGQNSAKVGMHYFGHQDPGAFVSISGGGVLKSSKNQEAAQKFLAYVTGKDGQAVLRDGTSFEYPVASKVAANEKLKPLSELDAPTIDPATLNSPKVVELMQEAGLL
ncbi:MULTISPECIES: iron ABC transporter substrate-binding protein [Aestuariimicrobium]|uniref:iron ABC transporter substrate-binding protein n=1 Tax=Aestuariimicrobium TaxID=396388 RepID=UPI0003B6C496|nr:MULTISPECIES: iron ABC transporter substrate-binding protein [Aestuariimicrobium]CAI9401812.1 Fe(3+)-binding periplasmic protein [Aestuariimicrobium sp. T2.26MG-19.2B]